MSDKHTDAQGNFKKFDLTKDVPVTYGNSTGRATEGQAQTSAARSGDLIAECVVAMDRSYPLAITGDMAVAQRSLDARQAFRTGWVERSCAAQLADSTAPGAPEHAISAAMAEGNKHGVKSTVAAKIIAAYLAAPTAQQSQASGGAVPEVSDWQLYADRFQVEPEDIDYDCLQWTAFIAGLEVARAAAPLPQVQSEGKQKTPNPFPEGSPNENWRRGYEGVRHFGAPDSIAAKVWKMGAAARKDDDAAADQQPVTPSGVLD